MSAQKPNQWPTIFPPEGGHQDVAMIAEYINEAIDEARVVHNAARVARGNPPLSSEYEWDGAQLPKFALDGWSTRMGVPRYRMIGPLGIGGFGLHEFQGAHEVRARINEMQVLASGAVQPPAPPPSPGPEPPPPAPPPAPVDPAEPCPPGFFRSLTGPDAGKCLPVGGTPVPPPGPPTTGQDLFLGPFRITCRYGDGSKIGAGAPALARQYERLSGVFTFFSTDNWEVVLKYADLTPLGPGNPRRLFLNGMTDVEFVLTIHDTASNETRRFVNPGGRLMGEYLDFVG